MISNMKILILLLLKLIIAALTGTAMMALL